MPEIVFAACPFPTSCMAGVQNRSRFDLTPAAARDVFVRIRPIAIVQLSLWIAAVGFSLLFAIWLATKSIPLWVTTIPILIAVGVAGLLWRQFQRQPTLNLPVALEIQSSGLLFSSAGGHTWAFDWGSLTQGCYLSRPVPTRFWDPVKGEWRTARQGERDERWGPGSKGMPPPPTFKKDRFRADLTEQAYSAVLVAASRAGLEFVPVSEIVNERWTTVMARRVR